MNMNCVFTAMVGLVLSLGVSAEELNRVLLLHQKPDGHPGGTHEYIPGMKVIATLLSRVKDIEVTQMSADEPWNPNVRVLSQHDCVVVFVSEGAQWLSRNDKRLQAFQQYAKQGKGLVTIHWAMGTRKAEPIEAFVNLFGACHGGPDRKYKVLESTLEVADKSHPITTGLKDWRVRDEFYYALKQVKSDRGVKPLLTALIEGKHEMVAWSWERGDDGRSFGFSGLHFHDNWKLKEYQRLMLQGILWTLKRDIAAGGVDFEIDDSVVELKPSSKP